MAINLTIDGKPVSVPPGTVVADAAKKIGVNIPVFCYHPKLEPVGMCRMCLVEIGTPQVDRATRQPVLDADGLPVIAWMPKLLKPFDLEDMKRTLLTLAERLKHVKPR